MSTITSGLLGPSNSKTISPLRDLHDFLCVQNLFAPSSSLAKLNAEALLISCFALSHLLLSFCFLINLLNTSV